MTDNFGDPGPSRRLVVPPSKPGNADDCLDEIYAALVRHGYALTQGRLGNRTIIVLSKQHEPGSLELEPVVQIASMIPQGERPDPRLGILMRRVSGGVKAEVTQ